MKFYLVVYACDKDFDSKFHDLGNGFDGMPCVVTSGGRH